MPTPTELSPLRSSEPGIPNCGSTARDVCGIERTYLSHLRLGLLLSLLSSATLLQARLSDPEPGEKKSAVDIAAKPLGIVYFVASILAVAVGWWAYEDSLRGLLLQKAFVGELKLHELILGAIATLVLGTCLFLLIVGEA